MTARPVVSVNRMPAAWPAVAPRTKQAKASISTAGSLTRSSQCRRSSRAYRSHITMTSAVAFRCVSDQAARGTDQIADHVAVDLKNNFVGVGPSRVDPNGPCTANSTGHDTTEGVVLDHQVNHCGR